MSDDISADFGHDVTSGEPADSASATEIAGHPGAMLTDAAEPVAETQPSADVAQTVAERQPSADAAQTVAETQPSADAAQPADSKSAAGSLPTPPPSASADDSVAGNDLTLTIDGQTYDVGAPTLDFSGNGIADTVAIEQDGNVEYYVDSDQDGIADQIIVLDEANGALINHEVYDPATGTWDNVTEESLK